MGVKERRQREKEELRANILTAAREIAREEGWGAVTIRKVAESIEYSPPTIYEYFESKDDLLQQLSMEGFRTMYSMMLSAFNAAAPQDRLMCVALAHWDFAWTHPDLYQVMHGMGGSNCSPRAMPPEVEKVYLLMRNAASQSLKTEEANPEIQDPIDLIRCGVHGLITQTILHRMFGGQDRGRELVKRIVRDIVTAWHVRTNP